MRFKLRPLAAPYTAWTRKISVRRRTLSTANAFSQHRSPNGSQSAEQSSSSSSSSSSPSSSVVPDARWLALQKARIGRCLTFGLRDDDGSGAAFAAAAQACGELASDWREYVAGGEGFLTGKWRRGFFRRPVDWGEQDSMGHVNNVVYNRYAESARINWAAHFANVHDAAHKEQWAELWSSRGTGLILRSIRTDFKFPMVFPDSISVYHKLHSRPEADHDGFKLDVLILSEKERRPAARCFEDLVLYDYKQGRKITFEAVPFALDALQKTFELQERAATENREKAARMMERIRIIEQASWDRPDAKEAFGPSS